MARTVRLHFTQRCCLRCSDIPRAYAITLNVEFSIFGCNVACEHLQPTLGSSVGRYSLTSQFTHHRTDIDDFSMPFLNHRRDNSLRHDKRSIQIYVDHLTELLCRHLTHRYTLDDTRIIHQNVNHSHFFLDLCNQSIHLLFAGDVTHISPGLDSQFFVCGQAFINQLPADVIKYDLRSCLRESSSQGKANAVRCTCDPCHFAL